MRLRWAHSWKLALFAVIVTMLACQVVPTPPPLRDTPRPPEPTSPPARLPTASLPAPPVEATPAGSTAPATISPGDLPAFPYQPGAPFAGLAQPTWQSSAARPGAQPALPVPWEEMVNRAVVAGLTQQQRRQLAENGFVILHSQEAGFSEIRQRVALRYGQPYYLTSDAAAHALRLTLDELLMAVEKEELRRRLLAITQAVLAEVMSYLQLPPGNALEADMRLAAAYLGVGLRLLNPQAAIDPMIEHAVNDQVEQILAADGIEESTLIPGFRDDFSAYRPTGHYTGDPDLEGYFRAMAWYNRVVWWIETSSAAPFASRVPLILTLALRRARITDPALAPNTDEFLSAAQEWAKVAAVISFLLGPGFDDGPAEYAALMDRVYSPRLTVVGLADQSAFELFQLYTRELPPLQQGKDPMASLKAASGERGWRFLGHGFRLDDYLLNQMTALQDGVDPMPAQPPGGVELFHLLGSPAASAALIADDQSSNPNNIALDDRLRVGLERLGQDFWMLSAPNAWLYALAAQTGEKGEAFPASMRTPEWAYKELNGALGGWAGLRRGPRVNAATPGASPSTPQQGSLVSGSPPGYVEPNPEAFYRLSHLANTTVEGLSQRGVSGVFSTSPDPQGLRSLLLATLDLGDRLQRLGDIAARELEGQPPAKEDWAVILAPLGPAEERVATWPQPPVGIAAIDSAHGQPLQAANGWIDRIYVLVPMEDGVYIAQGGIHSYYELPSRRDGLLSDEAWLRRLKETPPPSPLLAEALYLPEGNPVDVLAFRAGDAYRVLPIAGRINLRAEPDRFSQAVGLLRPGDAFLIIDGPVQSGEFNWWRVQVPSGSDSVVEGWLVGEPTWYERVW